MKMKIVADSSANLLAGDCSSGKKSVTITYKFNSLALCTNSMEPIGFPPKTKSFFLSHINPIYFYS